ncbi:MAG: hypothetical protein AMK73_04650 [Planctomycetes bacterium SM23_32]|nr:MAG: hypothetical protein AMK73_04650 [Planctomycetes bacterium SM23_32]
MLGALTLLLAVGAAAEAGVALSPLQQEVSVSPGRQAEFALTITNLDRSHTGGRARVRLEVVDFAVSAEGALSFGEPCAHPRSAVQWMSLEATALTLEPGQVRRVQGTVKAPYRAEGDYWAAVMMTILGPPRSEGVNVVLRTASAVFVRVARRTYQARPSVRDLQVLLPEFNPGQGPDAGPALTIRVDVANEGLVAFTASGEGVVYRDGRRRTATIPLHARRRRVLPGDTRRFVGVLPSALPEGDYTVRCRIRTASEGAPRAFHEAEFHMTPELAARWADHYRRSPGPSLAVEPAELVLEAAPGRFTGQAVQVANLGPGTMAVQCSMGEGNLPSDWVELRPDEFSLGPQMRRSVVCQLRVPLEAEPGEYTAALLIEAQQAQVVEEGTSGPQRVPLRLKVAK